MMYTLPTTLRVGGQEIPIRTAWTAALDAISVLADPDFSPEDKGRAVIKIIYKVPVKPMYQVEALRQAYWFLDGGQDYKQGKKGPTVMDWEHDWPLIVAPINRVIGHDVRTDTDLHWWTFLAAYLEIGGDCLLAQVVSIRDKQARHEKLADYEKKWATRNAGIIELPQRYTQGENDTLAKFGIKKKGNQPN